MDKQPSDEAKRQVLLAEIERQGGLAGLDETRTPVVSLETFFDGNHDLGSIGCNLWDHPGIDRFYQTLMSLRARADVQDILVAIHDVEPQTQGMWPFTDLLYILSRASQQDLAAALESLQPSEVFPLPPGRAVPDRLPALQPGHDLYLAWWD